MMRVIRNTISGTKVVFFFCFLLLSSVAYSQSVDKKSKASDELFRDGFIPKIRVTIPQAGIEILRKYRWQWGGAGDDQRLAVLGTVVEDGKTYTNVSIRLKGAAGSFRPVDQNPGLTLNFDKEADGQRFHGLQKL
jgi:spore coat protein CotH